MAGELKLEIQSTIGPPVGDRTLHQCQTLFLFSFFAFRNKQTHANPCTHHNGTQIISAKHPTSCFDGRDSLFLCELARPMIINIINSTEKNRP